MEQEKLWVSALKREKWTLSKYSKICSDNFITSDCYHSILYSAAKASSALFRICGKALEVPFIQTMFLPFFATIKEEIGLVLAI